MQLYVLLGVDGVTFLDARLNSRLTRSRVGELRDNGVEGDMSTVGLVSALFKGD